MSTPVHSPGVLSTAVHVLDPAERVPVVLLAGTTVMDPALIEQITNPRCWEGDPPNPAETGATASARKAKPA
ncbi:hypothetical protein [Streptomyces sp. CBMA152]|uniref:hypothetical protein n=1 Tax=Streptomyces sp. CBMA152 TaxID=1896312 RepID=UPI0016603D01|nr:hypothetical protein [Streptomyces sp. CBMA152]MBD0741917.1 hypothetical protein [Streptomyces sp. CBMA152]